MKTETLAADRISPRVEVRPGDHVTLHRGPMYRGGRFGLRGRYIVQRLYRLSRFPKRVFATVSEIEKDEQVRQLIEQRAIRKKGIGYDVGRGLTEAKERSETAAHFRNAHLCLFWTGKGRATPVVKLRKGAIVQPKKIFEVPSGYLGRGDTINAHIEHVRNP